MKFQHSALAVLAAAFLMAAAPALAATAVCTAKDSTGKRWTDSSTNILDFAAKVVAGELAKSLCQDHSKHPDTCKVVSCKVAK